MKSDSVSSSLVINDLDRTIDATESVIRHELRLRLHMKERTDNLYLVFREGEEMDRLAYVELLALGSETLNRPVNFVTTKKRMMITSSHDNQHVYAVAVPLKKHDGSSAITAVGQDVDIRLKLVFNNVLEPLPTEINQGDHQRVVLTDSATLFSAYEIRRQQSTVLLSSSVVESFTTVAPSERKGDRITYGPYTNSAPFQIREIKIHYQNDRSFLTITNADRLLEISHWGNLAIEEHYDMRHAGAKLKNGFSRLEYQRNPYVTAPASIRALTAILPHEASDIYFRDRIGNISTSAIRESHDKRHLEVDFLPRFPLFGGWKTQYYIGYNLPLSDYLFTDKNNGKYIFTANMYVPYRAPVENFSLRVVLPEGATNVQVHSPYEIDSESRETLKTYLDISGRTVVVLTKRNMVPEHTQAFTITYDYPSSAMFQKPLTVIGGLLAFCLFMMAYTRFDLTIAKTSVQREEENRERALELVEQYAERLSERDDWYTVLERVIRSGDEKRMTELYNDVKAKRQEFDTYAQNVQSVLRSTDAKRADLVQQIESKDRQKFELVDKLNHAAIEVKKHPKDKSKQKSIEQLERQYDALNDDTLNLLDQLSA